MPCNRGKEKPRESRGPASRHPALAGLASSLYLPALLADPIAHDLDISANWIFGAYSGALVTACSWHERSPPSKAPEP